MDHMTQEIIKKIEGKIICIIDGQKNSFESAKELETNELLKDHCINEIQAEEDKILLTLKKFVIPRVDSNDPWVKAEEERTGEAVSFF